MANMTPAGERSEANLVRTLYAANVHPLWDRYQALIPVEPSATDAAMHWRWRDMEPLAERAAKEAPLEERRALMLANPAFGGETNATANLSCGFTVLQPGDRAPRHRHTAPAIRFGVDSDGAATIVNGRRCEMGKGDLVLTPPMCWHGHINESGGRTVWFDALGHPLTNLLDASFFEPGGSEDNAQWSVDEGDETRDPQRDRLRRGGRGSDDRGGADVRMVGTRRLHRSTLGMGEPRGHERRGRPVPRHRPHRLRASRHPARGDAISLPGGGLGAAPDRLEERERPYLVLALSREYPTTSATRIAANRLWTRSSAM